MEMVGIAMEMVEETVGSFSNWCQCSSKFGGDGNG